MTFKKKSPQKKSPTAQVIERFAKDTNSPKISEAEVLAFLEGLEKGSEILKRSRNVVWRKLAEKAVDQATLKVLREIVSLKGFETLKTAYAVVRREQPKEEAKAEKEKESVS